MQKPRRHCQPLLFALAVLAISIPPLRAETPQDMHQYLKGHHVYQRMCQPCHGRRGTGDGEWAADLKDKPRNFRLGVFKFRTTPCGFLPTDDDLERTIRSGISGTAMPAFKELTEGDLEAVIFFVQNLSSRWDDPKLRGKPLTIPDPPAWYHDEDKLAGRLVTGKQLFETTCAICHGATGEGDGPGSKGLKDVRGNDITAANLTAEHHKSGDAPTDLYRTIAAGLDGTPMMGFHAVLKPAQIWSLVAYIESLEKAEE